MKLGRGDVGWFWGKLEAGSMGEYGQDTLYICMKLSSNK